MSDFVEQMCKKFSEWKNNGKLVMFIRHNDAPKNKVFIKIANELQQKLGVTMEYSEKGMPHSNQLAELGFADIAGKARTMVVQANLPEDIKYSCVRNVSTGQCT